jgi:tripartite-type tricarboxylate transporter receptor subunit TctC
MLNIGGRDMVRIAGAAASRVFVGLIAALALAGVAAAQTDNYPSRPIRLILPQPAGGAVDLIARTLGDRLSEQMGQPVIVENQPGANGALAAGQVLRAAADGYTLFFAVDNNLVINPSLYPNLQYVPLRDFAPIGIVANVYMVLVANPKVQAKNLAELIAFAKANPGKLNYASIGLGTLSHLGMELLKLKTGTDFNLVSYRGTAPAMTDVVAGVVEVMFTGPPSAKAMSEGGKLKVLAIAAPERSPLLPDVPTTKQAGLDGFELSGWFGMLAPAKTPKAVVDRLSQEVNKAVADPKFSGRIAAQGLGIVRGTPDAMRAAMEADTAKWKEVIQRAGIKIP